MNRRMATMYSVGVFVAGLALADVDAQSPQLNATDRVAGPSNGTVVTLDVPNTPGEPITVVVPIDGELFTLALVPHSVRAPGYQLKYQAEDGAIVRGVPGVVRTLRGSLVEVPGSAVAASLLETGLAADIFLPGESGSIRLEPWPTLSADQYVVYRPQRGLHPGFPICRLRRSHLSDSLADFNTDLRF